MFEPYDPAFLRDPYPEYARMRSRPPFFDDAWGLTFFGRHADVMGILRHGAFGRDIRHVLPDDRVDHRTYPTHLPIWYRMIRGSFIDLEPPEHTRLRGAVSRAFTRRRAEMKREDIRRIADRLIGSAGSRFDAVADLATPLPVAVIAGLMGVDAADHGRLLDWSHAIVRVFDLSSTEAEQQAAERAVVEFSDYLRDIIARRRATPGDDLISEMVTAPDPLPDDDLVASCILILNAGHEATVHALGNAVLALARHPDQYARLVADPELVSTAADELLRFDSPLQMFERWVLDEIEWAGVRLAVGDKVGLLFGAANRDPEAFDDPDTLDVARMPNPHVSFGAGTHFCLGAALARVEIEEALAALTARFNELHVDEQEPPRLASLVFRGVTSLQVHAAPR